MFCLSFYLEANREEYYIRLQKIHIITHSQYSIHLLDTIFERPIFETTAFITPSKINKKTAMTLIKQLREAGIRTILREWSGRRAVILCFSELLNIAEEKQIL